MEALKATKATQAARTIKASKSNWCTQKPTKCLSQNILNLKLAFRRKPAKPVKVLKPLRPLLRKKDIFKEAIIIDLSLLTLLEPKIVQIYYMAIWRAYIGEVEISLTSTQYIIGREFYNKIAS